MKGIAVVGPGEDAKASPALRSTPKTPAWPSALHWPEAPVPLAE